MPLLAMSMVFATTLLAVQTTELTPAALRRLIGCW